VTETVVLSDAAVIILALVAWFVIINILVFVTAFLMAWPSKRELSWAIDEMKAEIGHTLLPVLQKMIDEMASLLERED
jgi:hypothetical protein